MRTPQDSRREHPATSWEEALPRFAIVGADIALMVLLCASLISGPPAFRTSAAVTCPPQTPLKN